MTSIGGSAFWCPNITTVYINGQAVASMLNDIYSYSAGGLLNYISTGEKVYIKTGLSVPSYITQNFRKQSTTETVNNIEYDVYIKN